MGLLGLFVFFGVVVRELHWWQSILPLAPGTKMVSPHWNGRSQINLLIFDYENLSEGKFSTSKILALASLNPNTGFLRLLIIPDQMVVYTPKGNIPVSELFPVGVALNPPAPTDFLISSLQDFFAVPIDGYVAAEAAKLKIKNEKLKVEEVENLYQEFKSSRSLLKLPELIRFIQKDLRSNLTVGQMFKVLRASRGVRFDKFSVKELSEPLLVKEQHKSKEEFRLSSEKLLDEFSREFFAEDEIKEERLKVIIKNGTRVSGLANFVARFVENLGAEVIAVDNAPSQDFSESRILDYASLPRSKTVKRLEDILQVESKKLKISETQRADVEVIVGKDWAR